MGKKGVEKRKEKEKKIILSPSSCLGWLLHSQKLPLHEFESNLSPINRYIYMHMYVSCHTDIDNEVDNSLSEGIACREL